MTESLPLILAYIAGGVALGVYGMHLLSRSKTIDARGEAIKAVNAAVTLVAKLPNEDDVIADANARKAANAVALEALKAKIAAL
jgi:hypothetical protein